MKKHIVIDARLYGPKHTGPGRYIKNLLIALSKLPQFEFYNFTVIVYASQKQEVLNDLSNSFQIITTDIPHYSLREQIELPFLLYQLKPDLVHFPHFNKPILYFGKSVVTIHDLIKNYFRGKESTTKSSYLYWLKYFAYRFLVFWVIKTTQHIIVPSNYWRNYLINNYHINPNQITTTYEAIDPNFPDLKINKLPPKKYLIYTGNLYPHKNINVLLQALTLLPKINLKIICARSVFSQRIEKLISKYQLQNQVQLLGFVPDKKFPPLYQHALAFVYPTLMEGFGLPPLEAMAMSCPVISSNSTCLPEIYHNAVLYFDPTDHKSLVDRINQITNNQKLRNDLIKRGKKLLKLYSWDKTANLTLAVYERT